MASRCSFCGITEDVAEDGAKFQVCSGCKAAHYCSHECQSNDWKKHHEGACVRWVNRRQCAVDLIDRMFMICNPKMLDAMDDPTIANIFSSTDDESPVLSLEFSLDRGIGMAYDAAEEYFVSWVKTEAVCLYLRSRPEDRASRQIMAMHANQMNGPMKNRSLRARFLTQEDADKRFKMGNPMSDHEKFKAQRKGLLVIILVIKISIDNTDLQSAANFLGGKFATRTNIFTAPRPKPPVPLLSPQKSK